MHGASLELTQAYLIDAGWIFFACWGMVLLAIGVAAFGRDLLPSTKQDESKLTPRWGGRKLR